MEAVTMLWRARIRRRWRAWSVLVLLLGLGAGAGLACLAGARRTASSFARIAAATNEPDVNSSHELPPAEAEAIASGFSGVARHQTVVGFVGFVDGVDPLLVRSFLGPWDEPLSFTVPRLRAGRHPRPDRADEVLVTSPRAEAAGLKPGTRLTVRLLGQDGGEPEVASVVVTGIGTFAFEVAADTAQDRSAMVFTPAFTRAHAHLQAWSSTALQAAPGTDVEADLVPQLVAAGWSSDEVHSATRARVQDALRPLTTTLSLLGVLVLAATLVVAGQALARQKDVVREDAVAVRAMGFAPGQARALDALTMLAVIVPGAVLAWAVAIGLSPLFPVGSVRRLDPARGLSIDVTVLGLGALAVILLLLATSRLGSRSKTGPLSSSPTRLAFLGRLGPAAGAGVRQALGVTAHDRRRFWATVAFTAAALGLVVGGLVFVEAQERLSAEPRRYGVGWDLTSRNAYGDVDPVAMEELVAGDPDITGVAGADLSIVLLDERLSLPSLAVLPITASLWPTVVDGHVPRTDDEVLVGTAVLKDLAAEIGDPVRIRLAFGPTSTPPPSFTVRIAGTAVFPSVELAGVDATRLGTGVALTWERYRSLQPPDDGYTVLPDLMFFDLADGVDPQAVVTRYGDGLPETSGFTTTEWLPSLAPAEVRETQRATGLIQAVIAFLALTVVATIANAVAATVRRRGRDYAILKALGMRRRQVQATVAWQAVTPVAIAVAVGVPVGVAGGRGAWRLFAQLMRVIDTPAVPILPIVAVVLGTLVATVLVALRPGVRAARVPALTLRRE